MNKKQLEFITSNYWKNLKRDDKTNYIFCPDMNCNGFYEEKFRCISSGKYFSDCPKKDEGFRVLHCYHSHPNKFPLDICEFLRMDCEHKDCSAVNFSLMSGIYVRIPLELFDDFLKKDFREK